MTKFKAAFFDYACGEYIVRIYAVPKYDLLKGVFLIRLEGLVRIWLRDRVKRNQFQRVFEQKNCCFPECFGVAVLIVEIVRHAMSMDEKRSFFRQHLWSDNALRTDVKQVWFPGVHSDVGGGDAADEGQLALGAFRWMLGEAVAAGLRVDLNKARKKMIKVSDNVRDACGPMHDSVTTTWKIAERVPRLV